MAEGEGENARAGVGFGSDGRIYLVDDDDGAAFAFMPPLPSNTVHYSNL